MNIKLFSLFFTVFLMAPVLKAAEANPGSVAALGAGARLGSITIPDRFDTFAGLPITQRSLLQAPSLQAPGEVERLAQRWMIENRTLVEMPNQYINPLAWYKERKPFQPNLIKLFPNIIARIGHIDGKSYIAKISGPGNRDENHNARDGKPHGADRTDADYARYAGKDFDTFQTISRAANYLRFLQVRDDKRLELHTPAKWLVKMPWVSDDSYDLHDGTHIIVQEEIPGLKQLDPKSLSLQEVADLSQAIVATPLWNCVPNCHRDPSGKLYVIDFEQPNVTPATEFYHQNPSRNFANARCGLEELEKTCADVRPLREHVEKLRADAYEKQQKLMAERKEEAAHKAA